MADAVGEWLAAAARVPLLTHREELELGRLVQAWQLWPDGPDRAPAGVQRRGLRARDRMVTQRGPTPQNLRGRVPLTCCCCYPWVMGSAFLPTRELMADISEALGLELNDPAVIAAFDRLVLSGQLVPFVPDWWELMGWLPGELGQVLQRGR